LRNPATLPSARVLDAMARDHDQSFRRFAQAQSHHIRETLLGQPLPAQAQARFEREAQESVAAQRAIEAADTMPFEIYRQAYLSPARLNPARSSWS